MQNRIKVVLIGGMDGKQSFVRELRASDDNQNNKNNGAYQYKGTIGVDFIALNYKGRQFQVWDTAGQERFFAATKVYLKDADAVIFIQAREEQKKAVLSNQFTSKPLTIVDFHSEQGMTPASCLDAVLEDLGVEVSNKQERKFVVKQERQDLVESAVEFHKGL
ncbi:hypothetical protein AQUSIP_01260 [Aquicella siphonis]|uniref:Uncharacterized protein n=1 Tax=Aquicella siphonis TaxID=254247 RepID=A0A5E4PE60_9COXI|nr:ADP-ribosylation factor-like protein [Aquicella siphonis]VVC74852.1 hypothetical protein AQUSIP_01260 [Aquicella siphonis]